MTVHSAQSPLPSHYPQVLALIESLPALLSAVQSLSSDGPNAEVTPERIERVVMGFLPPLQLRAAAMKVEQRAPIEQEDRERTRREIEARLQREAAEADQADKETEETGLQTEKVKEFERQLLKDAEDALEDALKKMRSLI